MRRPGKVLAGTYVEIVLVLNEVVLVIDLVREASWRSGSAERHEYRYEHEYTLKRPPIRSAYGSLQIVVAHFGQFVIHPFTHSLYDRLMLGGIGKIRVLLGIAVHVEQLDAP